MDEYSESLPSPAETNAPEMSVSELAGLLKRTIEEAYGFVRVRGELGRVVVAKSGHLYFDIKDDKATINSVMWKGQAARLPFRPEEGLEVVAEGKLSTYPGRSNYQLIAERMRPAGVGALMQLLEERKKKLAAEGLFDAARKKPIPYLPSVIGVVTSPTGAVIRDILHRVRERFPVRVVIWPALVQGERASFEVEAGIRGFNALAPGGLIPRPDLIIVARGGGSIEDLWPFNEERVVRAAADSVIPLISAVGHETDTTLIDFASDRRAPTPTGAAEMAVPVRSELLAAVMDLGARTGRCLTRNLDRSRLQLRSTAGRFPRLDAVVQGPRQRLDLAAQRFAGALDRALHRKRAVFEARAGRLQPQALRRDVALKRGEAGRLAARLDPAVRRRLDLARQRYAAQSARAAPQALQRDVAQKRTELERLADRLAPAALRLRDRAQRRFETQARVLDSLSYENVLRRGFALVTMEDGSLARSAASLRDGDALRLRFADGEIAARAGADLPPPGKGSKSDPPPQRPRVIKRRRDTEPQGDLF
jgi:exodeoxyribonuclease VII large subunit